MTTSTSTAGSGPVGRPAGAILHRPTTTTGPAIQVAATTLRMVLGLIRADAWRPYPPGGRVLSPRGLPGGTPASSAAVGASRRMPRKRVPASGEQCDQIPNRVIESPKEQIMADAPAQDSAPPPATVADVMQPPVTSVEQNDHLAAAAYLMKRANATALIVTQAQTGQPVGIITDADVSRAVADGKNPNDVRIYELMTANPTVVSTATSIRDAAKVMTSRRFRHLPVIGDVGLVGIVDITDVCRVLLETGESGSPAVETDHGAEESPSDPQE
jgi:CBS domain-containing protein